MTTAISPFPLGTPDVLRLYPDLRESRLNSWIRFGKLDPVPEVVRGRRYWQREHVEAVAALLGEPAPSLAKLRKVAQA